MKYNEGSRSVLLSILVVALSVVGAAEAQVATKQQENEQPTRTVTLWEQAQRLYDQASQSGATTATSAADWVGELYDGTTKNAQGAANATSTWISNQYNNAVKTGETSATTAKEWVVDDLRKIGTWQYKVVGNSIADVEDTLNTLGAERWECFAVQNRNASNVRLYLKRRHRSYLQQLPAKDLLRLAPILKGTGQEE